MDSLRHSSPGRLRRLRDELDDEIGDAFAAVTDPDVVLDEVDDALRPPRHERRLPTYGAIVLPTAPIEDWTTVTGLRAEVSATANRDDHDVCRYADGRCSTARQPPLGSWLERAACGLTDRETAILDQLLRFAVHDLGAAGIGALFVLGGRQEGLIEERMAPPPPLRLDHPSDLGPLRHVLAQVDGAAFVDSAGVLRRLGVRLIPSAASEGAVDPGAAPATPRRAATAPTTPTRSSSRSARTVR